MMQVKTFFLGILLILGSNAMAQELTKFETVPKQYSIEMGYRYNFSSDFKNTPQSGYSVLFDYAWQLSGFGDKKAAYISVPLGYSYFSASGSDTAYSILSYGWTVKHTLTKNKKLEPFIGYSLLLNQLRISDVAGSIIGHKTGMGFGFNYKLSEHLVPYVRFEYSYSRFGQLNNSESLKIQALEIMLGIRM